MDDTDRTVVREARGLITAFGDSRAPRLARRKANAFLAKGDVDGYRHWERIQFLINDLQRATGPGTLRP